MSSPTRVPASAATTAPTAAPTTAAPKPSPQPLSPALTGRYYTDPAAATAEQQLVFEKSWQLVGHESDLPAAGSRFAAPVAGREVLLVRREDGGISGHLNVCRHRGAQLLTEAQSKEVEPAIRCPYHGWTYNLDGTLVGAPEGRQIPCLNKAELGLFPIRVESFLGFLFANLDPDAVPLAESCAGLVEAVGRYCGPDLAAVGKHRIHKRENIERQSANWKVVVDNYLEGYHVPVAHPGLMRLYDYQRYTADPQPGYAIFEVHLREKPSSNFTERLYQRLATPMPGLRETDRRIWRYVAIYPNTLLDFYPDHVLAWSVLPDGHDGATLPGAYYAKPGAGLRTRLARRLNIHIGWITNDEDAELVARVQRGLSTPGYRPGPLSHRETAVAWFHDRIRKALSGGIGIGFDGESEEGCQ